MDAMAMSGILSTERSSVISSADVSIPETPAENVSISFTSTDWSVDTYEGTTTQTPMEELTEFSMESAMQLWDWAEMENDEEDQEDAQYIGSNESNATDLFALEEWSGTGDGSGGSGRHSATPAIDEESTTTRLASEALTSHRDDKNDGWTNLPPDLPPDITIMITPVLDHVVQGTTFTITSQDVSPNLPFFNKGSDYPNQIDSAPEILSFQNFRHPKADIPSDFRAEGIIAPAA